MTAPYETGGEEEALGERGRRVLEDTRAEERRRDPNGSKRRVFLKDNHRLRSDQDWWPIRLLALTGCDQGDSTLVIWCAGVRMEAGVQLRRRRQSERK